MLKSRLIGFNKLNFAQNDKIFSQACKSPVFHNPPHRNKALLPLKYGVHPISKICNNDYHYQYVFLILNVLLILKIQDQKNMHSGQPEQEFQRKRRNKSVRVFGVNY